MHQILTVRRRDLEQVVNLAKRRAWFAAPHAFGIFTIEDAKGKSTTTKLNFPANVDMGVLRSNFMPTTATLINAIIKGKITSAGVGIEVDLSSSTIRSTPDADSDVEEGAFWPFKAANGADTGFRIGTFDEAKMVSGTTIVDGTDTDVAAFRDRILVGQTVGLTNVQPSTDRGEDITEAGAAYEQFKSSRGKK